MQERVVVFLLVGVAISPGLSEAELVTYCEGYSWVLYIPFKSFTFYFICRCQIPCTVERLEGNQSNCTVDVCIIHNNNQ